MWVVKLGGSLYDSQALREWLVALSDAGRSRVVIVPGGGPFADQVRDAQTRWRFDDGSAHRMALLAMEQYGLLLCALHERLVVAHDVDEIQRLAADGMTAVWAPQRLALADPLIPQSWSVTSDSLAAWLANEIGAQRLVLVKPVKVEGSIEEWMCAGAVDEYFAAMTNSAGYRIDLVGAEDHKWFTRTLDS